MEDINKVLQEGKKSMDKAVQHTQKQLNKIRAGKANPAMLDGMQVEYYGTLTPLNQLSTINTPDGKTILIKPYEKSLVEEIEKAIAASDLGITPQNDGENVILNIPPLTEERRKEIVKQVKSEVEQGKVSVRNIRKELNDTLKKLQKEGQAEDEVKAAEEDVQKMTNTHNKKLEELHEAKEKEVMTI